MNEKSSSKNSGPIISERKVISSFEDKTIRLKEIRTKASENRKTQKLLFTNRLAGGFLIFYCVFLLLYILLPFLNFCSFPETLNVIEKIGTLLVAVMFGYYFYSL